MNKLKLLFYLPVLMCLFSFELADDASKPMDAIIQKTFSNLASGQAYSLTIKLPRESSPKHFQADSANRTYVEHSFGGLFGVGLYIADKA